MKLHTLVDLRGTISAFIHISDGKFHDVNALDLLLVLIAIIRKELNVKASLHLSVTGLKNAHRAGT